MRAMEQRMHLKMDTDLHERIRQQAFRREISMAEYIRRSVAGEVKRDEAREIKRSDQ